MSVSSVRGFIDKATIHLTTLAALLATLLFSASAWASEGESGHHGGGEANLVLPDLDSVHMLASSAGACSSPLSAWCSASSPCARSATCPLTSP